jgi:hypothetical protein
MKAARCRTCGQSCSVLPDGTLVEHPGRKSPALLCPGSRTGSGEEERTVDHLRYLLEESRKRQEVSRN